MPANYGIVAGSISKILETKILLTAGIQAQEVINGIYGRYELKYDLNTQLKEIYVLNGEPQIFQGLTYESVVSEVSNFYGPPKSSGFDQTFKRITTFETQSFNIVVGELGSNGSSLFTRITLK
jgi:hypothetical protein